MLKLPRTPKHPKRTGKNLNQTPRPPEKLPKEPLKGESRLKTFMRDLDKKSKRETLSECSTRVVWRQTIRSLTRVSPAPLSSSSWVRAR